MKRWIGFAAAASAALLFSTLTTAAQAENLIRVNIKVGGKVLPAVFYDNATAKSLIAQFPLTVPMQDLYDREMCYRFAESLPAPEATRSGYAVGDIAYWTPGRSLVIFYRQNGEIIGNLQKVGRMEGGVEFFAASGDAAVTFEAAE